MSAEVIAKLNEKVEEPIEEKEAVTKKDPKRVEQGKRLAAISKAAKEKKMKQRLKEEEGVLSSLLLPVGLGVASFVFGVWLMSHREKKVEFEKKIEEISPQSASPPVVKKKFESLD